MPRLIDADAFYKQLEEIRMEYLEEDTLSSNFAAEVIETVMDSYLQEAPTIEAEPVKHGEPLTLEELKQMEDYPVWVEVIDHDVFCNKEDDFDGWGMVRKSWVRLWDKKRADLVKVDYDFEDYGKEWRAFRMPVKHGKWSEHERG